MYKSGRQRYEKEGDIIYYPSRVKIEADDKVFEVVLRKALMCDVKSLYGLFYEYSKAGEMLPRSMSDIYEHLRDFYIVEIEKENGDETISNPSEIIGACALTMVWENLAEIRSLAVKKPYTRKLIGTKLIKKCIEEAKFFKITSIFALTYKPQFFQKSGFTIIDKSELPHKIWNDCINCVKFPDCFETAVMLKL
ncbi:MAG: N-acetyltransferase [Deltaproteobacteria bacterium]|nr:N-acetyltransferase [Deltaproteobacteria bacterium]